MDGWATRKTSPAAPLRPMVLAYRAAFDDELDAAFHAATAAADKVSAKPIEAAAEDTSLVAEEPALSVTPPASPERRETPMSAAIDGAEGSEAEELVPLSDSEHAADEEVAAITSAAEEEFCPCYGCGGATNGCSQLCTGCKNLVKRGCFLGKRGRGE